jgi:fructokinase
MERKSNSSPVIVGIGEVLWDILPEKKMPGGAPANVVFHCNQLGANAYLVSNLGRDDLGDEMRAFFADLGFKANFLNSSDFHGTGTVSVSFDNCQNPRYKIQENVAWDYIDWSPQLEDLAAKTDAVCFGSLAQRNSVSRKTIHRFLETTKPDCLRVFDINLRLPYPDSTLLFASLEKANVLKLNIEELDYLSNILALEGDIRNRLTDISHMFNLVCVALTQGDRGSILLSGQEVVDCPGMPVGVQDSVGAGDAFTAAMIMGLMRKKSLHIINTMAGRIAASVCTQAGAMVNLSPDIMEGWRKADIPIKEYRRKQTKAKEALKASESRDDTGKGR